MKYFKIFNETDNHNGFQYVDGLNIDDNPYNDDPNKSCVKGGFYFSDAEHICEFLHFGDYVREVTIPADAKMVKDPDGNKWRADKLFLHERKDLSKVETWKWMIDQGINIHIESFYSLRYSIECGNFEVIKFLVENGADIQVFENYAFICACYNGYIDIVKYLVENGADIYSKDSYGLKWAYFNNHVSVINYLESKMLI
jgi:hypothetical protein